MRCVSREVYLFCSIFILFACGKQSTTSNATTATSPPVGVVNDLAGFYVTYVTSTKYTYNIHRGGNATTATMSSADSYDYTLPCVINPTDPFTDIMCYLEADELDLYFNGLTLQYNMPSTLCTYSEVILPWYFKYPIGAGPGNSSVTTDTTASPPSVTDNSNSLNGTAFCAYDFSKWVENFTPAQLASPALPLPPGAALLSVSLATSSSGALGPNCCFGNYVQTTATTAVPAVAPTVTESSWGGSLSNCIGGPAVAASSATKVGGIPIPSIAYVAGTGVNAVSTVAAPIASLKVGNMSVANYFTSTNYNNSATFPAAFNTAQNPTLPFQTPLASVTTGMGPISAVTPAFYEFQCLDTAKELKARIRVLVRSWDTAGFKGVSTGPYVSNYGWEPSPFTFQPMHDFLVWDDIFPFTAPATPVIATTGLPPSPFISSYANFLVGFPMSNE